MMIQLIRIHLADGDTMNWDFSFSDHGTIRLNKVYKDNPPEWIKLENYQCPECTLNPSVTPTCPVAEVMAKYASDLADHKSFEKVTVEIYQNDGNSFTLYDIPLQRVVGELVRLGAFQYECPIGRKVKDAMTELPPFPQNDEVLEAFTNAFAADSKNGRLTSGEIEIMDELHDLFGNLSLRLDQVGRGDAHLNGVVILHSLSVYFSLSAPSLLRKFKEKKNPETEKNN